MTKSNDPIDAALESLRQSDCFQRDSFFSQLETRLMLSSSSKPRSGRFIKLAAMAAVIVASTGVVGFAAVKVWTSYFGPYYIDESGVVTDVESKAVGQSVKKENGKYETTVSVDGGQIVVEHDTPLNGHSYRFEIAEPESDERSRKSEEQ
jgi:hypothetical protein